MPGFLISIGRSLLNWMRPSSPVPARGTPPLQPDLPTGSQTLTAQREDGKMGRGRRTRARTRTLSSETEERPAKTRRASTTDVPKVSTGKATETSSKKGKIPVEANFISNQMAHRYQQKVDENMKKDDRGTEKVNVAFKHANRLVSDEGRRSDSLRLAKDAAGLSQVSSDDVRRHYSKVKKAIAHSCRKVGSGKRVGKFGNTYIYDCVPSPSIPAEVPDVKFSKKNIFRKEEEKKSHKVKCSCEGINCSVNCDCVRFTINAGKAFLFERLVIRTEGESFFTAGIVACGPECGCEGKCSIGIVQLNDLDLVEIFRRDEILGFGLRAKTNIAPGQIVLEFVGHIVDSKEREESTIYAFQVAAEKDDECQQNLLLQAGVRNPKCQDIYIEPTKEGNAGRFVNTSERPNLFPIRIWSNDVSPYKVRMFFVSERPIRAGEELFVSYGESYQEDHLSDVSCRCQTDHCENSDALKGFSLEQKIDYILEQNQEINNWLEKDGMDLRSIIRSWTTTKQEIFVLILRALLNRCLFYDSRTKAAAIAAFNQLFFDVTQKVIVENDFMCSPEQLEKRQKFTPINEE